MTRSIEPKDITPKAEVPRVATGINIDAEARILVDKWIAKKQKLSSLSSLKFHKIIGFARDIHQINKQSKNLKEKLFLPFVALQNFLVSIFSPNSSTLNKKNDSRFFSFINHCCNGTTLSLLVILLMIGGFAVGVFLIVK